MSALLSPDLLCLFPSSCTQQEQVSCCPSLLPYPQDHTTVSNLPIIAAEKLLPKQSIPSQIMCLNMTGLPPPFSQSGTVASASKLFWLWLLHGKGKYQVGPPSRLIKHLSSSCFPAAEGDGARHSDTVQGLWATEVNCLFITPDGKWLQI